ncbi:MAG TPA: cyclase family protein [Rhizomicrobium sp.]|nr:cyclase family protein [Rhizomicrobium sp.]
MHQEAESDLSQPSRRLAIQGIAAGAAITLAPGALAQAKRDSTPEDFTRLMGELSNWGRWGKEDQLGAVNLITPAKRKQAMGLVREGASLSMARDAETKLAVDNPRPIVRMVTRLGKDAPAKGSGGTGDTFFIAYHGYMHTHMDTLCHFLYDGKMYNGFSALEVTEEGAAKNSILNYKNGIITRGVLMDMARHKGVEYLEPGTPIYPEDLEAWEKKAGVKVRAGDVMLVRTGRWARRDALGPWSVQEQGLAGLHMRCAKWMHARDVAILGGDGAQDVIPSGVPTISQPIHLLSIVAMGMPIFDNCDLELIGREAEKRKRWEFLVTASPAAVPGGTGSVLNPIATF